MISLGRDGQGGVIMIEAIGLDAAPRPQDPMWAAADAGDPDHPGLGPPGAMSEPPALPERIGAGT